MRGRCWRFGARRRNVLFTARTGTEATGLVATIIPTSGMQLMDIEVEASNLRLAESAGVPVPHVHAVCRDETYVGGPFFVTSRVDGETVPRQVLRQLPAVGFRSTRDVRAVTLDDEGEFHVRTRSVGAAAVEEGSCRCNC